MEGRTQPNIEDVAVWRKNGGLGIFSNYPKKNIFLIVIYYVKRFLSLKQYKTSALQIDLLYFAIFFFSSEKIVGNGSQLKLIRVDKADTGTLYVYEQSRHSSYIDTSGMTKLGF